MKTLILENGYSIYIYLFIFCIRVELRHLKENMLKLLQMLEFSLLLKIAVPGTLSKEDTPGWSPAYVIYISKGRDFTVSVFFSITNNQHIAGHCPLSNVLV